MINFISPLACILLLSLTDSSVALSSVITSTNYLSSLSRGGVGAPADIPAPTVDYGAQQVEVSVVAPTFAHAPISYFAFDQLTPKGPRKNADVGQPHDATRPLTSVGSISAGTWWCAAGGWPSPALRPTTEIFLVFSGRGCVTDLDGMKHEFGPGDTVVLPKGWSGRWDIIEDIHKVWFVHDHPNVEAPSYPSIRAVIAPYSSLSPEYVNPLDAPPTSASSSTSITSRTIYNIGPIDVGSGTVAPGSFPINSRATTECFHAVEGVFFLTNAADGVARRCVAGDTVVLPKGWSGHLDVVETMKKLSVVVD
jgi:uncharacterized cupin superfamily protein